jgi:septal ring-binding cell division protein DamX
MFQNAARSPAPATAPQASSSGAAGAGHPALSGMAATAAQPDPAPSAATPQPRAAMVATAAPAGGSTAAQATETVANPAASSADNGNATDLLGTRITATRAWLENEAQTTLSIQLLGTNDEEQLKDLLNSVGKIVDINKVFVYRTVANKRPSLTVLYGSYTSFREAREALDKLPATLKTSQPILRTVQGVRAEIRQHEAS